MLRFKKIYIFGFFDKFSDFSNFNFFLAIFYFWSFYGFLVLWGDFLGFSHIFGFFKEMAKNRPKQHNKVFFLPEGQTKP